MILLVEDNEDDVFIMQRVLRKAAISAPLEIARNGRKPSIISKAKANSPTAKNFPFPP